MIDLGREEPLARAVLYTYWDESRFYQYTIAVSSDREGWTMVADASRNTEKATPAGYSHAFQPRSARYIRVTMIRNSANIGLHVVEVRAYGPVTSAP